VVGWRRGQGIVPSAPASVARSCESSRDPRTPADPRISDSPELGICEILAERPGILLPLLAA